MGAQMASSDNDEDSTVDAKRDPLSWNNNATEDSDQDGAAKAGRVFPMSWVTRKKMAPEDADEDADKRKEKRSVSSWLTRKKKAPKDGDAGEEESNGMAVELDDIAPIPMD